MHKLQSSISTLVLSLAALSIAACSDDNNTPADAGTQDALPRNDATTGMDATPDPDARVEEDAGTNPVTQSFLAHLDVTMGQLPEGIAVRGDNVYAGLFPLGTIVQIDEGGTVTPYATIPGAAGGATLGLAFGSDGSLYALFGRSSTVATATAGVYRVAPGGGVATPFSVDATLAFPNGVDLDAQDNLYVTDSLVGRIYKIAPNGTKTLWLEHDMLASSMNANDLPCGSLMAGFPIGANGIVVESDAVITINTEKASLVRIPINGDGSAGTPSLIAGPDCTNLLGGDGLVHEATDTWLLVTQAGAKLVRVKRDGTVEVVTSGGELDGPASVDLSPDGNTAFITNSTFVPPGTTPRPGAGVVKVELR